MKLIKTICALTLALLLTFSLAACGNNDFATGNGSSSPTAGGSADSMPQSGSSLPDPESTQPADAPTASENGDSSLPMESLLKPIEATVVECSKRQDGEWGIMVTGERGLSTLITSEVDETAGALLPGAVINITGVVGEMMSYPGQMYGKDIRVTVVEPGQNLIGLYLDVLNYLYDEDESMNPKGTPEASITYALDLTEVHNLSIEEKHALAYFFSCSHDTDWGAGEQPAGGALATFQDLVEQGEIDEKILRFEHGILFTIQDEPVQNDTFPFSMKKWRSDSENICHENCTARRDGDGWTFDVLP